MINRENKRVYVKRFYVFPFKPLLNYEYKKFGYKRCDVKKGKFPFFNTAYYVTHKEMPKTPLYSILYGLNFLLSIWRTLVLPALLPASILFGNNAGQALLLIILSGLVSILGSVFLASAGSSVYLKEEMEGKLDRIMRSHGWPLWSSYKDNDKRFCPPGTSGSAALSNGGSTKKTAALAQSPIIDDDNDDDDDDVILLEAQNGEQIAFDHIASIVNKGKFYVLLTPREPMEGLDDDECLVFEYTEDANGEPNYNLEMDDEIVDQVMASYEKLYESQNNKS